MLRYIFVLFYSGKENNWTNRGHKQQVFGDSQLRVITPLHRQKLKMVLNSMNCIPQILCKSSLSIFFQKLLPSYRPHARPDSKPDCPGGFLFRQSPKSSQVSMPLPAMSLYFLAASSIPVFSSWSSDRKSQWNGFRLCICRLETMNFLKR